MTHKTRPVILCGMLLSLTACEAPKTPTNDSASAAANTLAVAEHFLAAAGSGDMQALDQLMHDDFVWHNEGDARIPWIGNWEGRDIVLKQFLPAFGGGLQVTSWTTDYKFANGDQAVFIGSMSADATNTGASTGTMSWAVRVHVDGDQVKSWNWFEDSYAVSQAYHGEGSDEDTP